MEGVTEVVISGCKDAAFVKMLARAAVKDRLWRLPIHPSAGFATAGICCKGAHDNASGAGVVASSVDSASMWLLPVSPAPHAVQQVQEELQEEPQEA